jgi:hypothetical protein
MLLVHGRDGVQLRAGIVGAAQPQPAAGGVQPVRVRWFKRIHAGPW